jgi:hypothetical protein
MKNLAILSLGLCGLGCAYETSTPDNAESVDSVQEHVTTRAKTLSFQPAWLCDGYALDAISANVSCTNIFGKYCKYDMNDQFRAIGTDFLFVPNDSKGRVQLGEELSLAYVKNVACYNANESNEDAMIHYREGLPSGRALLDYDTIFEHIRDVNVRGTIDVSFMTWSDKAYIDTVVIALQVQDSNGKWVDKVENGNTLVYFDTKKVVWRGDARQTISASAKLPANEPVRFRVRTGSGAVSGSDVRFTIHDAELRGEECVPSNVPGECL